MPKIRTSYGDGGQGLAGHGNALHPPIGVVLRGMLDDTDLGTIASPDGVAAAGAAPTKAEYDVVVTLVNEIKAAINAVATKTITKA